MADNLNFVYSLDVARLTGPAGEATRALSGFNAALERARKTLERVDSALPSTGNKFQTFAAQAGTSFTRAEIAAQKLQSTLSQVSFAPLLAQLDQIVSKLGRVGSASGGAAAGLGRVAGAQARGGSPSSFLGLVGGKFAGKLSGLRDEAAEGIASLPGTLLSGAASGIIGGVTALVSGSASLAYNLGKATIAAQSLREESVEGFKAIYGSSEIANTLFDEARVNAKQTKFDTADVVKIYNTLAANNFRSDELSKYAAAVEDIESARKGKGETFLNAISRLRGNAQASFGQFQSAGLQGPGIENVFNALAEIKGLKQNTSRADFLKLFRSGKVTREEALDAVTTAVSRKYDTNTGQLGEFAKAQGDTTFAGAISNIRNGLGDVLNSKRIAESGPLGQFKKILQDIGSSGGLFDETTARGQKFADIISRFVDDVFVPFGGLAQNSGSFIDKLLVGADALEKRFRKVVEDISSGVRESFANPDENVFVALTAKVTAAVAKGVYVGLLSLGGLDRYSSVATGSDEKAYGNLFSDIGDSIIAPGTFIGGAYDLLGGERGELPSLATGGVVPGPYGSPQLIIAHGGEIVSGLQGEYLDQITGGASGSGGGTKVYVENLIVGGGSGMEQANDFIRQLEMMVRNPTSASAPG